MSDAVLITLIMAGLIFIVFLFLLFLRPEVLDNLSEIVAGPDGISIKFFKSQGKKVAELRGGEVPSRPAGADLKGKAILWVDDNPENNFHEASMFEALGADVTFVRSNEAAVYADSAKRATLIISDIRRNGASETGLDLPLEFEKRGRSLPPLVYYTGTRTEPLTPGGYPVTIEPAELFFNAVRLLQGDAS